MESQARDGRKQSDRISSGASIYEATYERNLAMAVLELRGMKVARDEVHLAARVIAKYATAYTDDFREKSDPPILEKVIGDFTGAEWLREYRIMGLLAIHNSKRNLVKSRRISRPRIVVNVEWSPEDQVMALPNAAMKDWANMENELRLLAPGSAGMLIEKLDGNGIELATSGISSLRYYAGRLRRYA